MPDIQENPLINHPAEQSVIGSVLIDNECHKRITHVSTSHFSAMQHKVIWEHITKLLDHGQPVDMITLSESLESADTLDSVGGFAYLADLAKNTPTSANVVAYADILVDYAQRRAAVRILDQSIESFHDFGHKSPNHFMTLLERINKLQNSDQFGGSDICEHISVLAERWSETLESRFTGEQSRGLKTGIESLDNLLHPKQVVDGSLFVIGARPKMGKTALALKIIDTLTRQGHCTQVFSMEMTNDQLVERSLVQLGNVSTRAMYPTNTEFDAPDEELAKVLHTLGDLKDRDLWISDKPALSLNAMERSIRHRYGKSGGKLKAVFVDYLTLMDVDQSGGRLDLPYARITQRLKVLAKELNLTVFLLVQLNRSLEQRPNKRPMPSDGRETGQIEQDCDYWLGIYRDHVYNPDSDPTFTELLMRLNRHGQTGTAHAKFAGGRFDDWFGDAPVFDKPRKSKTKEY